VFERKSFIKKSCNVELCNSEHAHKTQIFSQFSHDFLTFWPRKISTITGETVYVDGLFSDNGYKIIPGGVIDGTGDGTGNISNLVPSVVNDVTLRR